MRWPLKPITLPSFARSSLRAALALAEPAPWRRVELTRIAYATLGGAANAAGRPALGTWSHRRVHLPFAITLIAFALARIEQKHRAGMN